MDQQKCQKCEFNAISIYFNSNQFRNGFMNHRPRRWGHLEMPSITIGLIIISDSMVQWISGIDTVSISDHNGSH